MVDTNLELANWRILWKTFSEPDYINASDDELTAIYLDELEESGVKYEDDYEEGPFLWAENVRLISEALDTGISVEEILRVLPDAKKYFEDNEIDKVIT